LVPSAFTRAPRSACRLARTIDAPLVFWTMLMGVWSGLNAVWLAGDLFSLYVA
jgi:hypothetical protein